MKIKALLTSIMIAPWLTSIMIASCSPVYAGELVENDRYELPEVENPAVHVACRDLEAVTKLLDTLEQQIQIYLSTGLPPEKCEVFVPAPILLPAHELYSLYVADDNRLFGIVRAEYAQGQYFWSYIDGNLLVISKGDT